MSNWRPIRSASNRYIVFFIVFILLGLLNIQNFESIIEHTATYFGKEILRNEFIKDSISPEQKSLLFSSNTSDTTPPQLSNLTFSNNQATLGDIIEITMDFYDENPFWDQWADLYIQSPDSNETLDIILKWNESSQRLEGNFKVTEQVLNGIWTVEGVYCSDRVQNSVYKEIDGYTLSISGSTDVGAIFYNVLVENTTYEPGESINISIESLLVNEYTRGTLVIYDPLGYNRQSIPLVKDSSGNGFSGELLVTSEFLDGEWDVHELILVNNKVEEYSYILTSPDLKLTISGATPSDVSPPIVKELYYSSTTAQPGDTIHFSIFAEDDRSKDKLYGYIGLQGPSGGQVGVQLSYDNESKLLKGTYNITSETRNGVWYIASYRLYDEANNSVYVTPDANQYTFEITGGLNADVTAPTVSDFKISSTSVKPGDVIEFSMLAVDDRDTERISGLLSVVGPGGVREYASLAYDPMTGRTKGTLTISNQTRNGTWSVWNFWVGDGPGNDIQVSPDPYQYNYVVTGGVGIDVSWPIISIGYYDTTPTVGPVVVTVSTNEGSLNASSYTFYENGSFEFIATDDAGNVSKKLVTISHIYVGADQTKAFISRFYELVLNRTTDPWGLNDWTTQLLNGERSGADVAYGFVFSDEFKDRELSDEQYVNIMYEAFFNRSADAGGYANWMDALNKGMSRYYVLRGFTDSQEFKDLASSYGINPGSLVLSQPAGLYPDITAFVTRFYKETLNRMPDEGGLNDWVNQLQKKTRSGADVAYGFIFSDEFKAKNLNNDLFVKTLYSAFFGREADTGGYNDWMNRLASGQTREQVLKGFLGSAEFGDLCTKYGINPGI